MKDESRKGHPSVRKKLFVTGIGFLLLVMLVTSFFGKKGYRDLYLAKKSFQALQTECRRLEDGKKRLEQEIEDLKTNPQALEKEAREKLWLMKPDEKVIVIKGREASSVRLPSHAETEPAS